MLLKKILIPIIIAVVVLTAFFGPFVNREAYADESFFGWNPAFGFINPNYFSSSDKVPQIAAVITYYVIWTPANLFLALGGWAMDTSISLTLTGNIFSGMANEQNGAVAAGWGLSRDIINIFLIFILLYIAIATILQVSGYGAKELLTTLIIIAFLVNFSLVITKMIIDASNVLAVGFYNAFPQTTDSTTGQTKIQVSQSFKQAFDLDKIVNQINKENETPQNTYIVQFLTYLLGAGIAAIAGFIFMVFAVLFVIRMVSLLILMILAPLAFGAMILPSTKSHATKWWSTLFAQAFFAPAGLFMLWLAAKMSTSMHSLFQNVLGVGDATVASMLADAQNNINWENIAKFVLQFIIIAIILMMSIIISKQLGAMGADSTIKGLKKAGAKAQGYAGRIGRYGGTRLGGMAAEKVLKSEGKAASFVRSIPLATRGLAGVSALEEKRKAAKQKEYEKAYGTYSEAGLKAMQKTPIITPTKRRAVEAALEEKIEKREKKESKEKEVTKLNELISQRKSELSRERESGVPDIQKILDIEKEIMELENTRIQKAKKPKNLTDQLKEALKAEIKEEMGAVKPTTPKSP